MLEMYFKTPSSCSISELAEFEQFALEGDEVVAAGKTFIRCWTVSRKMEQLQGVNFQWRKPEAEYSRRDQSRKFG
jgi:hypothetical protein